jgi:hypothetical protein
MLHACADKLFSGPMRSLPGRNGADPQALGELRKAKALEIPQLDDLSAGRREGLDGGTGDRDIETVEDTFFGL